MEEVVAETKSKVKEAFRETLARRLSFIVFLVFIASH